MIGLSERDRTLLRSLLQATQARTGLRWDGGPQHAAVHFIDIDGHEGAAFWQSLADADRRDAAIVISAAAPVAGTHWLPKPLRSVSLLGVLEQMTLPARPATGTAASAAATDNATARTLRGPKPGEPLGLLHVLEGADGVGARTVQSPHWPDLVIGNGNSHAMRTAPLENYAVGFAASLEVSHVGKYTGGPLDDELRIEIDTLLWLALLYAPINEIADLLPRATRARLRNLPAFGNLPHKLHHIRMAAALVQHPATLAELAELSATDEETARRFLGACGAVGLLEEIPDVPPQREAPPAPVAFAAPARVAFTAPARVAIPAPARVAAAAPAEDVVEPASVSADAAPENAIDGEPSNEAEASADAAPDDDAKAAESPPAREGVSALERLRATREQNRARVAAAIRSISTP
jgi:hypothetical protein